MAKITFNSNSQNKNLLRVRVVAKLVVIFICITLLAQRLIRTFTSSVISDKTIQSLIITLPILSSLSLIVLIECFLYRKLGLKILKYSKYFDILFTLAFTAEWMVTLNAQFAYAQGDGLNLYLIVAFASFGWRALLPILTIQQWQFKIIPPTAAYTYLLIYITVHRTTESWVIIMTAVSQPIYVILIYYFEHKINFTRIIGNVQNEQWLQLNSFILNNIPENIVIMDSTGTPNFISENFKRLLQRHNLSEDIKKFLGNIKQIQRVQGEKEADSESDCAQVIL